MAWFTNGFGVNGWTDWVSIAPTFIFVVIMCVIGFRGATKEEKLRH